MTGGPCPCGGLQGYDDCCGRLHRGLAHAPTAEALMRSRYSAFVVGDVAYLRETWHPHTRPPQLELDLDRRWTGLQVTATSGGGVFDTEGTVEFEASYEDGRGPGVQHENSTFVRDNRRWFYVAGRG